MHWILKGLFKFLINGVFLYALTRVFSDFIIAEGWLSFVIAALILTLLNIFVRPILKLITFPLILLTFGLFNFVLYIVILYIADAVTATLTIGSLSTLVWAALVLGIVNSIF
jgi:putative membrane protein